jgi:hypothetical protein
MCFSNRIRTKAIAWCGIGVPDMIAAGKPSNPIPDNF